MAAAVFLYHSATLSLVTAKARSSKNTNTRSGHSLGLPGLPPHPLHWERKAQASEPEKRTAWGWKSALQSKALLLENTKCPAENKEEQEGTEVHCLQCPRHHINDLVYFTLPKKSLTENQLQKCMNTHAQEPSRDSRGTPATRWGRAGPGSLCPPPTL